MQLCEEVVNGLAAKGHEITVLTSTQRDGPEIVRPYPVYRLLTIDPDWHSGKSAVWQFFVGRSHREEQAIMHLRNLAAHYEPQIIFFWHTMGLPRVLLQTAERHLQCATVYYLADYVLELQDEYLAYWQVRPVHALAKALKALLAKLALYQLRREGKPLQLHYPHVICVSEYVRQRLVSQQLIASDAAVIHNGVDLSIFNPQIIGSPATDRSGLSCLIAGRVTPEKGIHTAIEALALLGSQSDISLTILGDGPTDYAASLRRMVVAHHLQDAVKFEPPIPRSKMPEKLSAYNVLLLPSEYAEPIARSMQEAMAMGLLVIGTTTGGSGELLRHEETGLVFEAANARSLAQQLQRVLENPGLAIQLAQAGQARVRHAFTIDLTINRIEEYLQSLLQDAQ